MSNSICRLIKCFNISFIKVDSIEPISQCHWHSEGLFFRLPHGPTSFDAFFTLLSCWQSLFKRLLASWLSNRTENVLVFSDPIISISRSARKWNNAMNHSASLTVTKLTAHKSKLWIICRKCRIFHVCLAYLHKEVLASNLSVRLRWATWLLDSFTPKYTPNFLASCSLSVEQYWLARMAFPLKIECKQDVLLIIPKWANFWHMYHKSWVR